MATAVQQPPATGTASPTTRLLTASFAGAVFVLAAVAVAGYVVPSVWETSVAPALARVSFVSGFLRLCVQVAAVGGLVYVGTMLAGSNPPKGVRGGIFLAVSVLIAAFFIARAVGLNMGPGSGTVAFAVAFTALVAGGVYLLASPKAVGWMHTLEEMSLFHPVSYKRSQGQRMRRYTLIGILIVGLSGVWAALNQQLFGSGDLRMRMPFADENGNWKVVSVLSDVQYSLPLLIAAAVLWFAWRAVNIPTFADFLVATEAEMNKVSWSTRKKLVQDTIVVLVTTVLLAVFLLGVDLFWGTLLSHRWVNVLPARDGTQKAFDPTGKKSEW